MAREVEYRAAVKAGASSLAQWEKAHDRLKPACWPEINPSFTLQAGAKVFTLGSCFARNIEGHLDRLGFDVPMQSFKVPPAEFPARPNGILNKYTPPSIYQELRWTADILERDGKVGTQDCEALCYRLKDGSVIDNGLSGFNPVSYERFLERRREIFEVMRHAFDAECVVVTPGLTEAWLDTATGLYIQKAPIDRRLGEYQARIKFVSLDFATCLDYLQKTIDLIRSKNRDANFLITTSPVPLARSFSGEDVIVANTHSKSILRGACGEIARANRLVDYFPSFESVMLTREWSVFEDDLLHVSEAFVGKIVSRLAQTYFASATAAARDFQASFSVSGAEGKEGLVSAIAMARRAHEAEPARDDYAIQLGRLLGEAGLWAEAERILREVLARSPASGGVLLALGHIQDQAGAYKPAAETFALALALDPMDAEAHARLGGARIGLGQSRAAYAELSRALAINPKCAEAHYQMAVLHRNCGFPGAAAKSLAKARKIAGDEPRFISLTSECRNGSGASAARRAFSGNPGLAYYASLARATAKRMVKPLRLV